MSVRRILAILAITVCVAPAIAKTTGKASLVNTLQGTGSNPYLSRGNVYPATVLPYGTDAWTPQKNMNGDGFKYDYNDPRISGFSLTHQCNSWMADYAQIVFMPEVGSMVLPYTERVVTFSHDKEIAKPYYYSVTLENGIRTEMTPTKRGGHLRFSFPKGKDAYLVMDCTPDTSMVKIDPETRTVTGFVSDIRKRAATPEGFREWYVITFDKPFEEYGLWDGTDNTMKPGEKEGLGKSCSAYFKFKKGTKVQMKCATSFISQEQAALNFSQDLASDKTIEETSAKAREKWDAQLDKISIEGATDEQMRTFYSCLYHATLYPRTFHEFDESGKSYYYSPYDGKIHDGLMFVDNGFWDTFRSLYPLDLILRPTFQKEYISTFLPTVAEGGFYPAWSAPGESGVMIGNHAMSILADAWCKGVRNFNPEKALAAYYHEVTNVGPCGGSNGRPGWKEYFTLGYVPYPEYWYSSAMTLEYVYDDWCAWKLARETGNKFYEMIFARQLDNWKNLFDPKTGFIRGRHTDGTWVEPFDPCDWGGPYCEGCAWHYTWSVFQDVQGLIDAFGGDDSFVAKIDSVFTVSEEDAKAGDYHEETHELKEMKLCKMGQYAHANEPIHHMPYLYCYAGQPWKTQLHVRQIVDRLYNSGPEGFIGDEDNGAMSAWYLFGCMGFYPVCPGTDQYVLGTPRFDKVTLRLEDGKTFVVEAENNSDENFYVQSVTLNGKPVDCNYITYSDIISGGTLHFVMGPEPNTGRGTTKAAAPYSLSLNEKR